MGSPKATLHIELPLICKIDIYSLRDQYWNNSQWVIDILLRRVNGHLKN